MGRLSQSLIFKYKGLHRGYSEDGVENDDLIMSSAATPTTKNKRGIAPARPPRKGSIPHDDIAQMNAYGNKGIGDSNYFVYLTVRKVQS